MEEAENPDDGPIPKIEEPPAPPIKSCALCGCSTPAVRCDRCSSQTFCLSCDDMYHRHPKRRLHLRKAVDSIWSSAKSPRLRRRTELPGDPSKIPIPPPRSKKRAVGGGRLFLKHELGSFGHSKMFDLRTIAPPPKDVFAGQKTSPNTEGTYENETNMATNVVENIGTGNDIYENENIPMNTRENVDNSSSMGQAPWNMPRTNISSPIQVSIPSSSPDMITNGQSFGYPMKPQSRSIADLTGAPPHPIGTHPYHLPHYPYMHPPMHPYSHSMAHLNCAQCVSSSWSNLMSPHPSPYFHPMPWGSANASLARGQPVPGANGHGKHGSVPSFADPNFHFPYPGGAFYANGAPIMDPNFAGLHHEAPQETQKVKRSRSGSRQTLSPENAENMEVTTDSAPEVKMDENPEPKDVNRKKPDIDEEPPKIPKPPSQPWSCLHCTYVNPPGIHICEICCKTSYGNASQSENQNEGRSLDSRNSDSPMELVNLDALSQSPDFIKHRVQKDEDSIGADSLETEEIPDTKDQEPLTPEPSTMLTTETQTSTTTKTTDAQTQNLIFQSIETSTDSIFPRQEISVQTDTETTAKNCSVATDPMISSQSMESLMSGFSAPPYQNRRAGWGRGASFSTQSLYERGRSRSPIPRSLSEAQSFIPRSLSEAQSFVRDSSLPPEEAMHSWSQAWLMSDPMYYKPHNLPGYGQTGKEDYFDGTWGSMDKLNKRVQSKQGKKSEVSPRPKLHRSLDDLKAEKTHDVIHSRELQFLQTVKEAERCGFSLEDLHVAYLHCGKENPVFWLEDNWSFMIKNVIALAAKYGEDNEENDVGVITASEAKQALHIHRGDIWDAVTECIENRQRKILELTVRGNFTQKQIADALKNNEGNVELAYADLLRASTRRHKFILSPGLSEDSEYNPIDESAGEHSVSTKGGKLDVPTDTKADKKKSDFLTKLSAIRQAQSERRKAREEKEMIRETTTQDVEDTLETRVESPQSESINLPKTEESSHQEPIAEEPVGDIEKELADAKLEFDVPVKDSDKKDNEDNLPEDYDTNWVESQGEWIEEYSDEQWDEEGDGQWVSLQKKYQSMEKEFEEEARQMAALWEKEELEDDVFEEEPKETLPESSDAEKMKQEQDAKFQQWVKVNLEEKSLSEPEENEFNDQPLKVNLSKEPSLSRSVEFDEGLLSKSPLQHYPTEFDLSLKTEPDWVDLEDLDVAEKEQVEAKFEEREQDALEVENQKQSYDAENSDEEWEKIDLEIEMLDEKAIEKMTSSPILESQKESLSKVSVELRDIQTQSLEEVDLERGKDAAGDQISSVVSPVPKSEETSELKGDKSPEVAIPKPPVRRRSKLNSAAIEEVLKSYEPSAEVPQISSDVPPALPMKRKDMSPENTSKDLYAVPDKHKAKIEVKSQIDSVSSRGEKADSLEIQAPLKPPRVNLSPSLDVEAETGEKRSLNAGFSKDASPVTSLSNESDCFADSESDPEIKIIRQKYMHRKASKHEDEEDDMFDEAELTSKLEEPESPSVLRKEVELQSKAFEFDPELPIPIGTRGSRVVEIDEVESPKAFREGTARPLQLFKVTKQSSTEMTPEPTLAEQNRDIDTMVSGIVKAYHEHVNEMPDHSMLASDSLASELTMRDNRTEFSIPAQQIIHQNVVDPNYYNTSTFEQPSNLNNIQGTVNPPQVASEVPLEISNSSIPIEPIPDKDLQRSQQQIEEDEIAFADAEIACAAAEYYFGRYNEVTVAKPKKRATVVRGSKTPAAAASKAMSTSEITVPPVSQPSVMEKSASPVMMPSPTSNVAEEVSTVQPQKAPRAPKVEPKAVEPPPEPEYLSFAEDYFFGSYNEVVIPKKGKKKIPPKPIPKAPEKVKVGEAIPVTNSVTQVEMVPSETNQTIASSYSTAPVTSALQHAESTTSLYFDTSSLMEDTFYLAETQEQSPDNVSLNNNDKRVKSVHFVDPQPAVLPPPRKNRPKLMESNRSSVSSYTSAADEFMFEQYSKSSQLSAVDKKKLHSYSEDFKLNHESDPSNFSSESFLQPSDQPESAISSEISVCTSKEPTSIFETSITGLLDKNTGLELSDEFVSHELSGSDKVQDVLDRQLTLTQDAGIASDSVSDDKKLDEDSLGNKRHSDNLQTYEFPEGDTLTIINRISENDMKSIETESNEQKITLECLEIQNSSKTPPSFDTPDVYKEAVTADSEISEADVRTSESALIDSCSNAGLKISEEGNTDFKMASDKVSEYSTNVTEKEISGGHSPVSEDILISDSYTVKLEGSSMINRIQDEEANSEIERDTYSVHIDEDFEDGLLLVEEAENLINEFCDIYPPGIFDIASSNEIQNLNTKNNKQESTYDSEHEWKLNEERYNTLNANFIENKLYKSKGSPDPHIADDKESLIIDIKSSAEGSEISDISQEASTSDLAGISDIGELAFASSEDLNTVSSKRDIYCAEAPISEAESGIESYIVSETSESIPVNVVQPLSILCQEAASTIDFEPSCSKSMTLEYTEGTEDEHMFSESEYSKTELLDASIDVSDESLVTSTRSSISTQIPVPSDVQIQDLVDELDYEMESKTPVQTAVEEWDETLNIPSDTDYPDETNLDLGSENVFPASLTTDPETNYTSTVEQDTSVILDQDDELPVTTDNGTLVLLAKSSDTDDIIVDNKSTTDSMDDTSLAHLDVNVSLTKDDDTTVSLPESEESKENIPMTQKEDLTAEYGVISDIYNSASRNQAAEVSVNREEQVEIQYSSDTTALIADSSELAENEIKGNVIDSCKDESPERIYQEHVEDNEDSCVSLMSHFYDEWFENVKTSEKSSILQQDVRSKYAAYYNYSGESSHSGSASENEDFPNVDTIAVSNLESTQVELSIDEIKTLSIEESKTLSIEESKTLSIEESKTLSIEESKTLSIEESKTLSIEDSKTWSIEESKTLPTEESKTLPTEESKTLSIEESKTLFIEDSKTWSIEESKTLPIEESKTLPIEESKTLPIEESKTLPIEEQLEQYKVQEVDTCDSSIETKPYDELPHQIILLHKPEHQFKDIIYEKDIKIKNELSDVTSEELDNLGTNRQITESAGFAEKIFTTTKSCQTDDSFEEDQFFDSFDDPLMDPSLYLPIDKKVNIEPVKVEIGIQCHIITSDIVVPSDKTLEAPKLETKTYKSEEIQVGKGTVDIFEDTMELNEVKNVIVTDVITLTKDDSSFEISEDSDSDLFMEPHSSHDDLDAEGSKSKSSFLCAEIDSGFSSGSDCGRRTYKQDTKIEDLASTSSTTGEICFTHGDKSEHEVKKTDRTIKQETEFRSEGTEAIIEATVHEPPKDKSIKVKETEAIIEVTVHEPPKDESIKVQKVSLLKSNEQLCEKTEEISCTSTSQNITIKKDSISTKVSESDTRDVLVEEDIFERAVTPIAIEKVPSIEDITFIEMQTDITEQIVHSENIVYSESCSTPTVEYFYGPLPASVTSEIPAVGNDYFVEALDLLDACASEITKNHVENALASLAYEHSSSKSDANIDSEELSESLSSFHELDDDSLTESASEYFLPSDDDDKASLKDQIEENNALKKADLNVSSVYKTSHTPLLQGTIEKSDLKTSSTIKAKEVKSNIQSSSLIISKKSTEESIDKKLEEDTESLSIEQDSLNKKDKTCDASEFEDSLYLESTSEYSLPADSLPKHTEKVTQSLPITRTEANIAPQVEFINNLSKSNDDFQQNVDVQGTNKIETLVPDIADSEVSASINKVQVQEKSLHPHTPELKESLYSEIIPEKSQGDTLLEKADSKLNVSQIISDVQVLTTQTTSVSPADSSELCPSTVQLISSETNIQKSSEIKPDPLETLKTSTSHSESSVSSSTVEESLYLESIPDYFASEAVSTKTEKVESSPDSQNVFEKICEENLAQVLLDTSNDGLTVHKKSDSDVTLETEIISTSTSRGVEEELKITSYKTDIPPVPSDIVRYLYYGDDITFEEDSSVCDDISFNSAHNTEPISDSGVIHSVDSFQSPETELKAPKKEADIKDNSLGEQLASQGIPELISQDFPLSVDEQSAEYQSIQTFSSDPECFESAYSEHESTDQWYELDASRSLPVNEAVFESIPNSEFFTETDSLTKEDGELPCIPELILEQGSKDNFPVAKVDSDEVTDISTHFTMTEDDSDKFSDIESDSSLQDFEAECSFPHDIQSKNGDAINDIVSDEAGHMAFSDDHQELPQGRLKESSTHENSSRSEVFLDPNANENVEILAQVCDLKENLEREEMAEGTSSTHENSSQSEVFLDPNANENVKISAQVCDLKENLEREEIAEDISPPIRDFNGNVTESPVSTPTLDMPEVMPLTVMKVSNEPEQQFSTTQSKEVESISSLESIIPSSSSFVQTPEDEFCDLSQITESCYTSPVVESEYWLDANTESILETEDSDFILPNEDAAGVSTSQNNINPIVSAVIFSEKESSEMVSSVEIQNEVDANTESILETEDSDFILPNEDAAGVSTSQNNINPIVSAVILSEKESSEIISSVEIQNEVDANTESILETEDSDFILPNEDAAGVSMSQNNIDPIVSAVILSEKESSEMVSSVEIQNEVVKLDNEMKENFPSTLNIENSAERVICSMPQEIISNTEASVSHDLLTNELPEKKDAKQVLNIQDSKESFVTDSFDLKDSSIKEIEPISADDKSAIIELEFKSPNENVISESLGQEEASRKLYETKDPKFEEHPRDADAMPSVVSDVIETECMLNFGNKEEIRVSLEGKVCHEVLEDSSVQIEPEYSLERISTSPDFISPDVVDNSSVSQDSKVIDLIPHEETFSFSKFGYLFKDGKLADSNDSVCETNSDSPLNVDLSVKHTEELTVSHSSSISGIDKVETYLVSDSELLEESEQSIVTMGQISTVLYPKTDDKQHVKDKGYSYFSVEPDDFDSLKKDSTLDIQPQEVLITDTHFLKTQTSPGEEVKESRCEIKDGSSVFKTTSDEIIQVAQLNENAQGIQSLVLDQISPKLDQNGQEESVNKDEVTDASFCTLSNESDSWHEEDSEALVEDFPFDKVDTNLSLKESLIDRSREIVPDQVKDAGSEAKFVILEEKQKLEKDEIKTVLSNDGTVSTITSESLDSNIQKEVSENLKLIACNQSTIQYSGYDEKLINNIFQQPSSKIESFSYSETDSANFHSACDDFDNTSIITSNDDFTDVPSHFTLTEGSEAWSDIETDTSMTFDDCEDYSFSVAREKTPTREDGGYTFREDNFYSFKGKFDDETIKEYQIESEVDNKGSVSEDKVEISESVIKVQESECPLPQFTHPHSISLPEGDIINETLIAGDDITVSSKGLNQETNVCSIETSSAYSKDDALEKNIKLDNFENDVKEQVLISQDNIDANISSFNVASVISVEKDNSEELSDLGNEVSEQSSYSMFETVSKDDESENFSDIESEIYGDFADSVSKADEQQYSQTFDFVPFAEESGKSTIKRNKSSKKITEVDSTDKKDVELKSSSKEMQDDSDKVVCTEFTTEKTAEQVCITDGKKTLSLSIADIVEASELQHKTDETTETLLLEQFADIKSLSEPLAVAEIFSTFEPDTAIMKIHEDVGDVSLHLEMTEDSDYWLEAETEYSISEFEDEAVSLSMKDIADPFFMDVNNVSDRHLYATSSQYSDATAAGISTSFYTDTEYSDQISDTCADISLQGGTTDNSDKWSDIEGDAAIDEALYGLANTSEANKEDLTTAPSFSVQEDHGNKKLSKVKIYPDPSYDLPSTGKMEKQEVSKIGGMDEKIASIQVSLTSEKSSDSVSESYTQPLSDPSACNISASGLSDEDFTSITPLDGTVDELDKFSDISNDSSLEEIQHDSKTASSSVPPKVTSDISGEEISLQISKETLDKNECKLGVENKTQVDIALSDTMTISDSTVSSLKDVATEDVVYEELVLDTIEEDACETDTSRVGHEEDTKEISETEEGAVDETGIDDRLNQSTSPPYENEDYENYEDNFEGDEYLEGEEYDPNIDEHEMEFGEEDYPDESVPYIENEDELVYPLQTEDWIGESFDLKEYGVDYAMSGSETDVHGYGINDEYEDMQRAIDFNISNFDEAFDNLIDDQNLTTESFKTISNNTPTQSKMNDKEHESWSTADADSIDDDLSEHDNVISKIDELLAEDFAYDHTDYYRDDVTADVIGNEEMQGLSPIEEMQGRSPIEEMPGISPIEEPFEIEDKKVAGFKVKESSTLTQNAEENIEIFTEAVKSDEQKISGIPPEAPFDRDIDNSLANKYIDECTISEEIEVGQLESVAVKEKTQVVMETESDSFKVKKSSQVVSDIVSSVDSSNVTVSSEPKPIADAESKDKMSIDESKTFTVKKPSKMDLETISASDSTNISEQSEAFTVKKLHATVAENTSVVSSTSTISSEQSESLTVKAPYQIEPKPISVAESKDKMSTDESKTFTVKKPSKDDLETISASDSTNISEQSEAFTVKKLHATAAENTSVVCSTSTISSEQSESLTVKAPHQIEPKPISVAESKDKMSIDESKTFTVKKPSKDDLVTISASDSTNISEQSEAFTVKKLHSTAAENTSVVSSTSKISSEQSESFTLKKPSQVVSEVIPVVDLNCKVFAENQGIETSSHSVSKNVSISDSHSKSRHDEKKELDLSLESSKSQFEGSESEKSKRLSKEDIIINQSLSISPKEHVLHSETETTATLPKPITTDIITKTEKVVIEGETTKLDSKTETKIIEHRKASATAKKEISETESNIPSESKSQTEKQLPTTTSETVSSTEHTDITVRRRRVRRTSSQNAEEESADPKPDIPFKRRRDSALREARKATISSPDDEPSDPNSSSSETSEEKQSKPDIPEKRKRKPALPKSKPEPKASEAPSLPPKTIKRDSSSDSISSSVFLSSSSESLSCYESPSLKDPIKTETVAEPEIPTVPDVPARKTSVRQRRKESSEDTSSSINRSSSSRWSYDLPPKESMDLCRKRTSIDERMVKLQAAGKCTTKETAFIAAKLIEMQFDEEDALLASRQCSSIYHAVKFLTQLCELCQCRFPINSMASMIHCAHRACKECLKAHFTNQIYDRSVFTLLCPICHKPDITDQNIQEYFNHLEMMFRNILDTHVYDLFQRKLRDEVLTKDPNFHWCSQCSSGFIASPRLKKLYCPDCSAITCALCHQTWELEHEGIHCERFQQWKDMHTPEPPPAGLVKFLTDRGITCPSCDINYAQACAGCMMYKCSHCSFEFCGFCSKPYKKGKECGNKQCELRGAHAHHPYTCLFFLRDKDVSELQLLLDEESVKYLTIPPKDQIVKSRCQVREQKHTHGCITEDRCGRDIVPYCAGLCRTHYYEYLAELMRKNKTNPLSLMTVQDLQFMLRKSRCPVPEKVKGESNDEFYDRLTETVSSILS